MSYHLLIHSVSCDSVLTLEKIFHHTDLNSNRFYQGAAMQHHFNETMRNACAQCIKSCESTVNELQSLIAKCMTNNTLECAPEIGKTISFATECIASCRQCIDQCTKHLQSCQESACKQMCQQCIDACSSCITHCQKTIEDCKSGNETCVPTAEACIQALNECSQACAACLKV